MPEGKKKRHISPEAREVWRKNLEKARKKWISMSHRARARAMPNRDSYPETKEKKKSPIVRYRVKDVGRPRHHYLLVCVHKKKGKRAGATEGKLITESTLLKRIKKAREKWVSMPSTRRKRVMPERKGKKGYVRKRILKTSKTGKKFYSWVWVKKK